MPVELLPFRKKVAYATGMLGWSLMTGIYMVMLIYYYYPPAQQGLIPLIPSTRVFGFITILALVMAAGRLFDAITYPMIAQFSDQSTNPKGRRIPLMRWAVLPTVFFCCMMYLPLNENRSTVGNIIWLSFSQFGFFLFMTLYNIPYNALLPELGHTSQEKLKLATYQGIALMVGLIMAAAFLQLSDYLAETLNVVKKIRAYQYSIWFYSIVAGIFLAIPAFTIDEKKYCVSQPSTMPIRKAIRETLGNRHFKFFLVADFSYNTAMAIVYSSLLYYVTVLLLQPDSFGTTLMGLMIVGAISFLGLMPPVVRKLGKKVLINFSFLMLGLTLLAIFFLGKYPIDLRLQGYIISGMTCIPLAIMSILPSALLADISALDGKQSGEQKEGLYFAVRNLSQKLGQTIGMIVIAILIQFGKDPGHDLGVRLTGIVGVLLCTVAAITFSFFREKKFMSEVEEMERTYFPSEMVDEEVEIIPET